MDREKTIQEIAEALIKLEECSEAELESTKKFLRWLADDALEDIRNKHKEALQEKMHAISGV